MYWSNLNTFLIQILKHKIETGKPKQNGKSTGIFSHPDRQVHPRPETTVAGANSGEQLGKFHKAPPPQASPPNPSQHPESRGMTLTTHFPLWLLERSMPITVLPRIQVTETPLVDCAASFRLVDLDRSIQITSFRIVQC